MKVIEKQLMSEIDYMNRATTKPSQEQIAHKIYSTINIK